MRVLLLSGGGWKGAIQVPIISHLMKTEKYDLVLGVSVGALNGILACQNDIQLMWDFWNSIDTKNPYFGIKGFLAPAIHRLKGLYTLDPLEKQLENCVSLDKIKIPFGCGMVARETGHYFTVKHTEVKSDKSLRKAILASSAIAFLMEPVMMKIGNRLYTMSDGGHRHVLPTAPLKATHIDAVFCTPVYADAEDRTHIDSLFESFAWFLNIQMEGNVLADFERLKLLAKTGTEVRVFAPMESTGSLLVADRNTILKRFEVGERALKKPILLGK